MKIVMTGGPSAGKTTIAQAIQKEFSSSITVVPEAASMLFQGGFPRGIDQKSTQHLQKAIFFVQRELEAVIQHRNPKRLILCDRGSLDGIAYWPASASSFFKAVRSNLKEEIARYDWVIHLDTAASANYDLSNPIRLEDYKAASAVNQRIKRCWREHPRRIIIPNHELFFTKIEQTVRVIHAIIKGGSFQDVVRLQREFQRIEPINPRGIQL